MKSLWLKITAGITLVLGAVAAYYRNQNRNMKLARAQRQVNRAEKQLQLSADSTERARKAYKQGQERLKQYESEIDSGIDHDLS